MDTVTPEKTMSGDEMFDQVVKEIIAPESPAEDKTSAEPETIESSGEENVEQTETQEESDEEGIPEVYRGKTTKEITKMAEDLKRGFTEERKKALAAERLIEEIMNYQPGSPQAEQEKEEITLGDIPDIRRRIDAMYRTGEPEQFAEAGRQQNLLAIKEGELRDRARSESAAKYREETVVVGEEAWIGQNIDSNTKIADDKKDALINAMAREIVTVPEWRKIPNYMERLFQDVVSKNPDFVVKKQKSPPQAVTTPSFASQAEVDDSGELNSEDNFYMKQMGIKGKAVDTYKKIKREKL